VLSIRRASSSTATIFPYPLSQPFLRFAPLITKKQKVRINSVPEWQDYDIPAFEYEAGIKFFLELFSIKNECAKDLFYHVTNATDTQNIKVTFDACKDIVLKNNLEDSGFMVRQTQHNSIPYSRFSPSAYPLSPLTAELNEAWLNAQKKRD